MKLNVTDLAQVPTYQNVWEVKIKVYYGDADGYNSMTLHPTTEEDAVLLIETLDAMKAFYPGGRGGGDEYSYNKVPGFEGWFGSSRGEDEAAWKEHCWALTEYSDFAPARAAAERTLEEYPEWITDPQTIDAFDMHAEATLDRYEVFFYDSAGSKFNVEVEK